DLRALLSDHRQGARAAARRVPRSEARDAVPAPVARGDRRAAEPRPGLSAAAARGGGRRKGRIVVLRSPRPRDGREMTLMRSVAPVMTMRMTTAMSWGWRSF